MKERFNVVFLEDAIDFMDQLDYKVKEKHFITSGNPSLSMMMNFLKN